MWQGLAPIILAACSRALALHLLRKFFLSCFASLVVLRGYHPLLRFYGSLLF
jgi:hypothetical protein